ncbi:hypothetical protein BT69DRAFT_1270966 [Atractiella rhizophila]|nr:hypothetical protein BT69DRAFT_1270966 [Atractiella rhizophila]
MVQNTSSGITQTDLDALDEVLRLSELSIADDAEEYGVRRFCFQHSKQVLGEKGTFVNGKWIEFKDWIDESLPEETRLMLRLEVGKDRNPKDIAGHIYVYELLPASSSSSASSTTYIKLGRSLHPVARLSQWRAQCPSRQLVLRDFYPLSGGVHGTRIAGAQQVSSEGGRNHKRWERLCLIEMAGRAEQVRGECKDCKREHKELFKATKGDYELWVRSMVLKWGTFCQDIL